ncbi:MAG: family 16 glycosylhydrolase [Verrucomicrobia bacterium]|nr:family 16 glycosylhydrolase [Verrucomicrobiota bacterium]
MTTWPNLCFLAGLVVGLGLQVPTRGADRPDGGFDEKQVKVWTLEGTLGTPPKRVTDTAPLSDQANHRHWVRFDPMSDEFDGPALDTNKWVLGLEWWAGRQPAPFCDANVTVRGGQLHLTMRKEPVPAKFAARGYHDYTTAAVHSRARTAYGYFEVRARPMNSAGSSAFWFQQDSTPGWATEIDVFEIGGNAKGFEHRDNMNVHVFRTPQEKRHWDRHGEWEAPGRLADDYHVYGLEWDPEMIRFYFDGVLLRTVENTHWHQPLYLIFDSETMGGWFGMPADADLPSTFRVDYVRAWKKGR